VTVQVKTSSSEYGIHIENGILAKTGEILASVLPHAKTFAIVSDKNVAPLYEQAVADAIADTFSNTISGSGINAAVISYTIPPGEKSKSAAQFFQLANWLAESQVTRTDAIIALGGGVVGDLAGFVAATYLRGIPFVQIPTTLLAMVDSSVGGKTAVDIPAGKNLVGAFFQPTAVICDPYALKTLPAEIFADGMAEVIKHGMIRSSNLLGELQSPNVNLAELIAANVKIKRDIVQLDEFDTGERQLLNFGHTIGHAIENLSGFEVSHGRAVAIGMHMVTRAAVKKGVCPPECLTILEELLAKFELPRETNFPAEKIFTAALTDKKRTADTITEVIPVAPGVCELKKIPVGELMEWIG